MKVEQLGALAMAVFERIAARIAAGDFGPHAVPGGPTGGLEAMRVTLHESHVAWAGYEADL